MPGYSLLNGIRVLEVAQLAPSSVGGHLADLGADVIKVESGPGDGVRTGGAAAVGTPGGPAFMHLRWNRGKRSVALDLRGEEGKRSFLALAEQSDVVIEGTRSGYLARLGLGPDVLAELKPSLVFCGISGLGSDGPYSRLGSGGPVFDGYAGLRKVDLPEEPPKEGVAGSTHPSIAMYALGAYGAMGVLAAILDARRTGAGKRIEVSGVDVAAGWIPDEIDAALNRDRTVLRDGWLPDGRLPDWPRLEAYRTSDGGAMIFGAHVEKFWRSFCAGVGREDLLGHDLATVDGGSADRAEHVWRELKKIFAGRTRAEWIRFFLDHDIAGGPVNTVDELVRDPHFTSRANTYRLVTDHGELELAASAVRVAGETFSPEQAPALGADTEAVLAELAPSILPDPSPQDGS
ncbi:CaiB/BaiF CoA transferase family protein [Actinomadura rugatobispora]|uniref:CaiB/BaiF CoA transferase family protein n=1 Tax=Actinomadura rugatobispora TaxID=1994 RepID=A0ABW0ZYP0_9ACTN|nr:CaiB/BaiF CoA-transferase family protein [Actinomadura rugatobispora]